MNDIEAKKRAEAERIRKETARRSRKRNAVIVTVFLLVMIPALYFGLKRAQPYLKAKQTEWAWKLHQIPKPQDWYVLRYGPAPSLTFRSPVVPRAVQLPDTLHEKYPDVVVLTERLPGMDLVVLTATAIKPDKKPDAASILQASGDASKLAEYAAQWQQNTSGKIESVKTKDGDRWLVRHWATGKDVRLLAVRFNQGPGESLGRLIIESAQPSEPKNESK